MNICEGDGRCLEQKDDGTYDKDSKYFENKKQLINMT